MTIWLMIVGALSLVLGLISLVTAICYGDSVLLGVFCMIIGGSCLVMGSSMDKKQTKQQREREQNEKELRGLWMNAKEKQVIPQDATLVDGERYFLWCTNDVLNWFPASYEVAITDRDTMNYDKTRIRLYNVPKENIYYYTQAGEIHTDITGTGGHSSYSLLTGFHGKINPVKISTMEYDFRCTQLFYREDNQDYEFDFAHGDIAVLRRLVPEKDYEVVAKIEAEKQIKQAGRTSGDEEEKLKKAKKLLEDGLITQEEYNEIREKTLKSLMP